MGGENSITTGGDYWITADSCAERATRPGRAAGMGPRESPTSDTRELASWRAIGGQPEADVPATGAITRSATFGLKSSADAADQTHPSGRRSQ